MVNNTHHYYWKIAVSRDKMHSWWFAIENMIVIFTIIVIAITVTALVFAIIVETCIIISIVIIHGLLHLFANQSYRFAQASGNELFSPLFAVGDQQ